MYTPDEMNALIVENEALSARVATLTAERDALLARAEAAEQAIVDVRAGYRHIIYALRGTIVGTLTGRMTRMLQTSLDAARALKDAGPSSGAPSRANVIIERVEDVMKMLADLVEAERNPAT
ncbi:MAG: hypothetical protein WCI67_08985 [Chloroflexales bacterium]